MIILSDNSRPESSSGGAGNEDIGNQLKQASMMIRVIEDRSKTMNEKADGVESLSVDYDVRDLKAKYSKLVEGTSKVTTLSEGTLKGDESEEKDDANKAYGDDTEDADTFDVDALPSQIVNSKSKAKPRISGVLPQLNLKPSP